MAEGVEGRINGLRIVLRHIILDGEGRGEDLTSELGVVAGSRLLGLLTRSEAPKKGKAK